MFGPHVHAYVWCNWTEQLASLLVHQPSVTATQRCFPVENSAKQSEGNVNVISLQSCLVCFVQADLKRSLSRLRPDLHPSNNTVNHITSEQRRVKVLGVLSVIGAATQTEGGCSSGGCGERRGDTQWKHMTNRDTGWCLLLNNICSGWLKVDWEDWEDAATLRPHVPLQVRLLRSVNKWTWSPCLHRQPK